MFGERIRAYRKLKGLKASDFAKLIGISQGSLSDIENNKTSPSAATLASLVMHTDIDARWLLIGDDSAPDATVMGSSWMRELVAIMELLDDKGKDEIVKSALKESLYYQYKTYKTKKQ